MQATQSDTQHDPPEGEIYWSGRIHPRFSCLQVKERVLEVFSCDREDQGKVGPESVASAGGNGFEDRFLSLTLFVSLSDFCNIGLRHLQNRLHHSFGSPGILIA